MKKSESKPLTPEMEAEIAALAAMPDSEIDRTDPDALPMSAVDLAGASTRGAFQFYKPIKKPVAMRLDADVLDWFQRQGPGYQTRINAVLREFVTRHR